MRANFSMRQEDKPDPTSASSSPRSALTKFQGLYLGATELADDDLKRLQALANPKLLNVGNTQVTAAGIAEFKAAWPNCKIEWTQPTSPPAAGQ